MPVAAAPGEPAAAGRVRVTLASATRRVDLVLPGTVPLAELLPELARAVGLLDPWSAHGGHRLLTAQGRQLAGDAGLLGQGVADGALLLLSAGTADPPPRRHDDVVEAVLEVVERDPVPFSGGVARCTSLVSAALLLTLGAVALLLQPDPLRAGGAALGAATGLLGAAVVLSRGRHLRGPAVTALAAAVGYAVAGGVLLATAARGSPALGGAAGAGGAGLVALVGLGAGRVWAIPAVLGGAGCAVGALAPRAVDVEPAVVWTVLLVLVTLGADLYPRLALGMGGTPGPGVPVDLARVGADVRAAREILLALSVSAGLAVVALGPVAVSLGSAGTALALVCCLVVLLRARQHRAGAQAVSGTILAVTGLLVVAGAVLVLHPSWRPGAAVVLAAAGSGVLAASVVPGAGSVRRGRIGDLVETAAALSLLPLVTVASGLPRALGV